MANLLPIRTEAANGLQAFSKKFGSPASLMDQTEAAACAAFGVRNLRHRAALHFVNNINRIDIVGLLIEVIADNYERGGVTLNKDRSREN